jgi:hypothetical protein
MIDMLEMMMSWPQLHQPLCKRRHGKKPSLMRPVQATTAWVLVVQAKASSPLKIEAQNILL